MNAVLPPASTSQSRARPIIAVSAAAIALIIGAVLTFTDSGGNLFMSHAHCYLFNRNLMLLHGVSDLMIGVA